MTSIWTLVIVTVQPTVTGVSLTKWSNPINYLQETNKKVGCQSYDKMKQTKWTKIYQLQPTPQNCLVPRPHYSVQLIRFGSLGPSKEVRPRQKSPKVRHPMPWVTRPKFHISRLKMHRQKTQMGRESSKECLVFF